VNWKTALWILFMAGKFQNWNGTAHLIATLHLTRRTIGMRLVYPMMSARCGGSFTMNFVGLSPNRILPSRRLEGGERSRRDSAIRRHCSNSGAMPKIRIHHQFRSQSECDHFDDESQCLELVLAYGNQVCRNRRLEL
jgi:hypothetical protein